MVDGSDGCLLVDGVVVAVTVTGWWMLGSLLIVVSSVLSDVAVGLIMVSVAC